MEYEPNVPDATPLLQVGIVQKNLRKMGGGHSEYKTERLEKMTGYIAGIEPNEMKKKKNIRG